MLASEMEKRLLTLELLGGVHVNSLRPTCNPSLHPIVVSVVLRQVDDKHTTHLTRNHPSGFLPISEFELSSRTTSPVSSQASIAVERAFGWSLLKRQLLSDEWRGRDCRKDNKTKKIGTTIAERLLGFVEEDSHE